MRFKSVEKELLYVLYDRDLAKNRPLTPTTIIGKLHLINQSKTYISVNPEFKFLGYNSSSLSKPEGKPVNIICVIYTGLYLIDAPLDSITSKDIYEMWLDTLKEVETFVIKNHFHDSVQHLTFRQFETDTSEFLKYLHTYKQKD